MRATRSFLYAACALILAAFAHIVGHLMGPEAIGFMGAPPDVVQGARESTVLYYTMMAGIIGLLFGLAWLAWKQSSGKLSRILLWVFAAIFSLRGALFVLFIPPLIKSELGPDPTKFWFHFFASIFVLSIGAALGRGLWKTRARAL